MADRDDLINAAPIGVDQAPAPSCPLRGKSLMLDDGSPYRQVALHYLLGLDSTLTWRRSPLLTSDAEAVMLTTRETATFILIGIFVLVFVVVPKLRRFMAPSLKVLIKAALSGRILAVFGLFLVWCGAWVALAAVLRIWNVGLLSDTIIIVLTIGFPLLFRNVQAKSGGAIMRQIGRETLALSALLLFYLNLEPFPLWVELIGQPIITLIVLVQAVSTKADQARLRSCLTVVVTLIGLGIIVATTVQFIVNFWQRDWAMTIAQLALSIWLPVVIFPYLYASAFYASTEKLILRMRKFYKPPARRRAVLAAICGLHLSVRWTREFVPMYEKPVARAKTFREALRLMRDFREDVVNKQERSAEREANLEAFAGEAGTDGTGAQLDRREFDGTKRALRFTQLAQALRYEQLGNRYWDDLTDMVLQPLDRYDLPDPHGITVKTSSDRHAWRAVRQMPSGSYLAIGGHDGEPGEWLYAGPTPPTNYPPADEWTDGTWSSELPPDWERNDGAII